MKAALMLDQIMDGMLAVKEGKALKAIIKP